MPADPRPPDQPAEGNSNAPQAESFAKVDAPPPPSTGEILREILRRWGARIALGAFLLGLVLYFALVSLLAYRSSLYGKTDLGWTDYALAPFRWSAFREKQGRALNARGLDRFKRGDFGEALLALRIGLSRSPHEVAPRITLATIYSTFSVKEAARELENGVQESPGNPDFIEALLLLWRVYGANTAVLDYTSSTAIDAAQGRLRAVLAAHRAEALLALGRPQEAQDALALLPAEFRASAPGLDIAFRAAVAAGALDEAQRVLAACGPDFPAARRARFACDLAVARGDDEALARALRRLPEVLERPYEPYFGAFYSWSKRGRATLRDRVHAELLEFHHADPEAMKRFGAMLVSLRDSVNLRATISWLEQRRIDTLALQAQLTELTLREGHYAAAFRLLELWEPTIARYQGVERSDAEFVRRLTRAACDASDAQATLLGSYLAGLPSPLAYTRYQLALEVLPAAGRLEAAALIAEEAQRKFPLSDAIIAKDAELTRAVKARREEEARKRAFALEESQRRFADREATIAELNKQLQTGESLAARATLRDLRETRPPWMNDAERDLVFLETATSILIDEAADARNALRRSFQVLPDEPNSVRLLRWAGEIERTRPAKARMIREEVAEFGFRSDATRALLSRTDWEDAARVSIRTGESARQAMDEALARRDPDHVMRLLGLIRRTAPTWLAAETDALAVREMRARLQLHQKPAVTVQVREMVRRRGPSRTAVHNLIRELANGGNYDDALFIATKWTECSPEDEDAANVLSNLRLKMPL